MLQTWDWKRGVNEKTFPAKPTPDNQIVAWEHNGGTQTFSPDGNMFNMILRDGTRSDNAFPMIWDGDVLDSYDYFLPQNKRITAVTIYYYGII